MSRMRNQHENEVLPAEIHVFDAACEVFSFPYVSETMGHLPSIQYNVERGTIAVRYALAFTRPMILRAVEPGEADRFTSTRTGPHREATLFVQWRDREVLLQTENRRTHAGNLQRITFADADHDALSWLEVGTEDVLVVQVLMRPGEGESTLPFVNYWLQQCGTENLLEGFGMHFAFQVLE